MSARLLRVDELEKAADFAGYSVSRLAKEYGRCTRQLHRDFIQQLGHSPKEWLNIRRQHAAFELLRRGDSVKRVAILMGYAGKSVQNFSRDFKKVFGVTPSKFALLTSAVPFAAAPLT